MAYDLVQDEPKEDDLLVKSGERTFLIQKEIAKDVDFFEIDYHNGWIRKVFVIFPNGEGYS